MALTNEEALKRDDALYDKYVRPLEDEHWGKFVAVAPDGRTMLGTNPYKIDMEAWNAFGGEAVMFQVGDKDIVKPAPIRHSTGGKMLSARISWSIIRLYQQYGKQFEAEHRGEFVAITDDGRTMLGTDRDNLFHDALKAFGTGVSVFEVGRETRA